MNAINIRWRVGTADSSAGTDCEMTAPPKSKALRSGQHSKAPPEPVSRGPWVDPRTAPRFTGLFNTIRSWIGPLHPKQRSYSKHSLQGDRPGQHRKKRTHKGSSETYLRLGHVRKGDPYFDQGTFFADLSRQGWCIKEGELKEGSNHLDVFFRKIYVTSCKRWVALVLSNYATPATVATCVCKVPRLHCKSRLKRSSPLFPRASSFPLRRRWAKENLKVLATGRSGLPPWSPNREMANARTSQALWSRRRGFIMNLNFQVELGRIHLMAEHSCRKPGKGREATTRKAPTLGVYALSRMSRTAPVQQILRLERGPISLGRSSITLSFGTFP